MQVLSNLKKVPNCYNLHGSKVKWCSLFYCLPNYGGGKRANPARQLASQV